MKRSALFYLHQRAGARFVEHCGWELPASFTSAEWEVAQIGKSAGIADLSHYRKFDLKTQPAQPWWRLGANHYLIIGEILSDPPSGATDVTSVYANFRLVGPRDAPAVAVLGGISAHRYLVGPEGWWPAIVGPAIARGAEPCPSRVTRRRYQPKPA